MLGHAADPTSLATIKTHRALRDAVERAVEEDLHLDGEARSRVAFRVHARAGSSAHRMRAARRVRRGDARARLDRGHVRDRRDRRRSPKLGGFDAIVAMGGPMSVNDERVAAVARRREAPDRRRGARGDAVLRRVSRRPAAGREPRREGVRRDAEPEVGHPAGRADGRGPRRSDHGQPRRHDPDAAVARRHVRPARGRRPARRLRRPTRTRRSGSGRAPTASSSTSRSRPRWPRSGRACPRTQAALEQTVGVQRARRHDRGAARRARTAHARARPRAVRRAGARSPRTLAGSETVLEL